MIYSEVSDTHKTRLHTENRLSSILGGLGGHLRLLSTIGTQKELGRLEFNLKSVGLHCSYLKTTTNKQTNKNFNNSNNPKHKTKKFFADRNHVAGLRILKALFYGNSSLLYHSSHQDALDCWWQKMDANQLKARETCAVQASLVAVTMVPHQEAQGWAQGFKYHCWGSIFIFVPRAFPEGQ